MAKKKKGAVAEDQNTVPVTNPTENPESPRGAKKKGDYTYVIKNRKARRETKHRKAVTITAIILLILLAISGIIYGAITAVELNSFKVFVDSSGNKVLSLAEHSDFNNASEVLEITGPGTMDNTTLASGMNQVDSVSIEDKLLSIITGDGTQCTDEDSFIAASFYLKNTTNEVQNYSEFLRIKSVTKNIDAAVRVMLVREFDIFVYAKPKADGSNEKVVPLEKNDYYRIVVTEDAEGNKKLDTINDEIWYAENFYDDDYIFYNTGLTLQPGEIRKYSILLWIEGWDADCTDDKLHGTVALDFGFEQHG